ncbi:hypothetical protein UACE39S_04988 [Ureibacillus acetophenoni]
MAGKVGKHTQPIIFGGHYMTKVYKLDYDSPIGVVEIIGTDAGILSILFFK